MDQREKGGGGRMEKKAYTIGLAYIFALHCVLTLHCLFVVSAFLVPHLGYLSNKLLDSKLIKIQQPNE